MQYLCSEDQREYAEWCCACKFPLPPFCSKHAEEHLSKGSGHFLLPLSAHEIALSKPAYVQMTEWLIRLNRNFDLLRDKFEEFSKWEEAIEAAYQEAQNCLIEARLKAHQGFLDVKSRFLEEINNAINETRLHALETQTFHPGNPLSQLLWYYTPVDISTYQMFAFKATCMKEFIDSVFQVSLQCTMIGLEHWKIEGNNTIVEDKEKRDEMEKRLQEAMQLLQQEQYQHQVLYQEYAAKSQHCSNLERATEDQTKLLQTKETQLAEFQANLEQARTKSVDSQIHLLEEKLDFELQLKAKDEHWLALKTETVEWAQKVKILNCQLEESQRAFDWTRTRLAELGEEPDSSRSWQKAISVKPTEVKFLDTSTGQWQLLYHLDTVIKTNYSSSSTFIGENRIFVCGGGERGPSVDNPYVNSSSYVLERDGHVLPQANMSTGRYAPGIIYDSLANAVYVFGGAAVDHETMRCSEKFMLSSSIWQSLPDMCEGRSWFNPCIYCAIIYLCGGKVTSAELYNPRSNSFALLPDFTLPEDCASCTAVVHTGNIVVISKNYVCWWNLELRKVIGSEKHPDYITWSNCLPVVVGDIVYTVDLPSTCRCISMRNGVVEKVLEL